jgi:hypothetical protein
LALGATLVYLLEWGAVFRVTYWDDTAAHAREVSIGKHIQIKDGYSHLNGPIVSPNSLNDIIGPCATPHSNSLLWPKKRFIYRSNDNIISILASDNEGEIFGLRPTVINGIKQERPFVPRAIITSCGIDHAVNVNESTLSDSEGFVSFFKSLPLLDEYGARYRAHYEKAESKECNGHRRVRNTSIGFLCVLVSFSAIGYALRYGIYKARSGRQYSIAASSIIIFFLTSIQGYVLLITSASIDCGPENVGVHPIVIQN